MALRTSGVGPCPAQNEFIPTNDSGTIGAEMTPQILEGLKTFLRIPSISTLPEHKPDIRRAAEFCLDELQRAGMNSVRTCDPPGTRTMR